MRGQDFADRLAGLLAREQAAARGDTERMGEMIERLAAGLGFTIALAADGDRQGIDQLFIGAEAYAHQEAVDKAPLAQMLARLRPLPPMGTESGVW